MRSLRFFSAATLAACVLLGAGCLGGSSKVSTGGVWLSQDVGVTWKAMHALPLASGVGSIGGTDILSFAVDPSDDSVLYVGTKASGLFMSFDGGATWNRPEDPEATSGAILDIAVSPDNVCTFYVLKAARLLKTTTCGRTFNDQAYVEGRTGEALTTLAIDWNDAKVLYLGTTAGEIYKTTDGASTWSVAYSVRDAITTLEVNNADNRFVVAGSRRSGLLRSETAGETWVELEDSLKSLKGSDRVYALAQAGDGSLMVASTKYGLLTSSDHGLTWSGLSLLTAAGDVTISALAVSPRDAKTIMYATNSAFYRTVDGGSTWSTEELPSSRAASTLRVLADGSVWLGVQTLEK